MERDRLIDLGIHAASALGLWYVARMALSKKQRQSILDRDNHQSQVRTYNEERGWHTLNHCADPENPCTSLHVHHIVPQRWGGKDEPNNLITVPECVHVGRCKSGRIDPRKAL